MEKLKTDYKDQLLDTSVNTERKFNIVDAEGDTISSGVTIRDITSYSQDGDSFGAADINKMAAGINELNNNLTAAGTPFRFGKDTDGNYGYIITDEAGADSVIPFSSGISSDKVELLYTRYRKWTGYGGTITTTTTKDCTILICVDFNWQNTDFVSGTSASVIYDGNTYYPIISYSTRGYIFCFAAQKDKEIKISTGSSESSGDNIVVLQCT